MPSVLDGLIDQSEVAQLYIHLLRQKVKEQYKGHQDYHLMLKSIDTEMPIVGGEVQVQKEDEHGNYYTVTYHVTVKDDLGNFIRSIDDLGGQCMKGEICKKGFIFTCMECGEPFCRRHVKFVDNNPNKPLCRYGFMGWEGCYSGHRREYSDGGIKLVKQETDLTRARAELAKAKVELEAAKNGRLVTEQGEGQRILPPLKKTGLLGRFLHGSVYTVRCGYCDEVIGLTDIACPECRNIIDVDIDSALVCPVCGANITRINCPNCGATNTL